MRMRVTCTVDGGGVTVGRAPELLVAGCRGTEFPAGPHQDAASPPACGASTAAAAARPSAAGRKGTVLLSLIEG